jgi:tetratricopeptide (TPR) repeat protein
LSKSTAEVQVVTRGPTDPLDPATFPVVPILPATGGRIMKTKLTGRVLQSAALATAIVGFASAAHAQGEGITNQMQMGTAGGMTDQLAYGNLGAAVERDQSNAYQAFLKEHDSAKKIEKGQEFLKRFPKSLLAEQVDAGLMDIYRTQADWKNEYAYADQALALNPKDVDVLATVGWTIPHVTNPNDPDAQGELDKAEKYAKQALEILAAMPKPSDMSEAQFIAAKSKRASQAHSALGLVYFRRENYDGSVKELQESFKGNPFQDQTAFYVLGVDLMKLNRFGEAADAFTGCSQLAGPLQAPCKQQVAAANDARAGAPKTQ